MSMAIKSFENLKTKDIGSSNVVVCPVCGKATEMRIYEFTDASMLAHLLQKKANGVAICPKCATPFTLNPNYLEQKKLGTVCTLEPQDLSPLYPKV